MDALPHQCTHAFAPIGSHSFDDAGALVVVQWLRKSILTAHLAVMGVLDEEGADHLPGELSHAFAQIGVITSRTMMACGTASGYARDVAEAAPYVASLSALFAATAPRFIRGE